MKMKLTLTKLMMIVIMAILPVTFYAQGRQTKPVERYFYIFAEGGLSINHTDLANYGFIPFYQEGKFMIDDYVFHNFDGTVGLGYQFGKVIGMNAKFGTGTLGGEKRHQLLTPIGLSQNYYNLQLEKTTFMEANLNLTFNLTNLFFGYNPRRVFNFIPHIGVGGIRYHAGKVNHFNTLSTASGEGAGTTEVLPAKTDATMTYTVPVGAEINFNVAPKLDIFVDYTFTYAGDDALDQTTKAVDDIQVINDMYSSLNLGLRFKFNNPCDIDKMARDANQITMKANPDPLKEENGKVCFDVIFTVPANYFQKQAVMNITPTMNYKGGSIDLDPVTFVGEKVKGNGDFVVNYKNGGEFTKHYCIDYVEEMQNSTLNGNPMFYVYQGTIYPTQEEIVKNTYYTQGGQRKIADGVIVPPAPTCEVSNIRTNVEEGAITVSWNGDAESYDLYITTEDAPNANSTPMVAGLKDKTYTFTELEPGEYHIYVKANCKNDLVGEWQAAPVSGIEAVIEPICIIYFDYNSSVLKPNTKVNKSALKALASKLASGEPITEFELKGWASPEGEYELNNNLANDRANVVDKAVKDQMKKLKLNAKDFTFTTKGYGPDWDKFIELVKNSNIADKDQIVRVIENSRNREQEIKNMINVYPELEKDILPLIRRTEVYAK
ncbi:MAG: hypothetical protein IKM95_01990 [Bacteroidales bacterium]|nr:hypothetical protein [Bacteroidales bacterium]